jgi:methylase of polypeptide subunit release factors
MMWWIWHCCWLQACSSSSGAVITFLGKMLKEEGIAAQLIALDVNPLAIEATLKTARENEVLTIEVAHCRGLLL